MKQASEQYRAEMREPWRGQWLLNLYIGFIQEKFQASAVLSTSDQLSFLSENYDEYIFKTRNIDRSIATFEKDMFKADGSSSFIDKAHTGVGLDYYGVVSEELSDSNGNINVELHFTSNRGDRGIKGLTLDFYETYPILFNISAYTDGVQTYTKDYSNSSLHFESTDVFGEDAEELVITIKKMNKPYVRFRLSNVLFGVGVSFTNDKFLSTQGEFVSYMHPYSISLPTKDLSIVLDNADYQYDIDKVGSLVNLISIGQDVSLQIGYKRLSDGVVESLPSEKLELASYDLDSTSLKLTATDFLRNENTEITWDDEEFFNQPRTLYDVALEMKQYIQNEEFTVILDDALKDVPIEYTSINGTCKSIYLMIAGAARCTMSLTERGLDIRRTDYTASKLSATASNMVPYADISTIVNKNPSASFASFEKDKIKADGRYIFPDKKPSDEYKAGYISSALSNLYGSFSTYPTFTITSQEVISPDYLTIVFKDCNVQKATIKTYYNDSLKETIDVDNLNNSTLQLKRAFESFNKVIVTIKSIREPYRRVTVQYFSFDKQIYDVTLSTCTQRPTMILEDMIRNIIVYYSHMTWDESLKSYQLVQESVSIPCNRKGTDVEYTNPLITTAEVATDVGNWLKEYYQTQVFYDIPISGDPTIEADDMVRIPSEFNDNILCDVETATTTFANGGIRGTINVRRRNDDVVTTQNRLANR